MHLYCCHNFTRSDAFMFPVYDLGFPTMMAAMFIVESEDFDFDCYIAHKTKYVHENLN